MNGNSSETASPALGSGGGIAEVQPLQGDAILTCRICLSVI
jgi:hypothetical protein